jgi:hypothetical protein
LADGGSYVTGLALFRSRHRSEGRSGGLDDFQNNLEISSPSVAAFQPKPVNNNDKEQNPSHVATLRQPWQQSARDERLGSSFFTPIDCVKKGEEVIAKNSSDLVVMRTHSAPG